MLPECKIFHSDTHIYKDKYSYMQIYDAAALFCAKKHIKYGEI